MFVQPAERKAIAGVRRPKTSIGAPVAIVLQVRDKSTSLGPLCIGDRLRPGVTGEDGQTL